jgi:hypothetical protein
MDALKKFLGPNWHVKILGWLTALFTYIALNPNSVEFLPDGLEKNIVGSAKLLMVVAGGATASVIKGSKVTGGSVAATGEAKKRLNGTGDGSFLPEEKTATDSSEILVAAAVDPIDVDEYERIPRPLIILED